MKGKKIILFLLMIVSLFLITFILIINKENITNIFKNTQKKAIGEGKIDATYRVVKIEGETINATVTFDCDTPIEKIVKPDGVEIAVKSDNKQKVAIDYNLISGNQYIFKIKLLGNSEEKEYTLYANKEAKPIIKQDDSLLYPLMTLYGVKLNKNVTIDYGNEENNYYSTDGGNTWKKYEGQMTLQKECTITARSFKDENEIVKVDTQEIKMNLANDALGAATYDGNKETYECCFLGYKINVDSSAWGKTLNVKFYASPSDRYSKLYLYLYQYDGTVTEFFLRECDMGTEVLDPTIQTKTIQIPQNTYYIKTSNFETPRSFIYEMWLTN